MGTSRIRAGWRSIGAAVLLLWMPASPTLAQIPEPARQPATAQVTPPLIRDIVIEGSTALARDAILARLRISVGDSLDRPAEDLARALQDFYVEEDYSYATATGRFDEATGRLTLVVDEGRIDSIAIEGIDEDTARRFEEDFEIRAGDVFNRRRIRRALNHRLEPARGALETAPGQAAFEEQGHGRPRGRLPFELIDREGRRVLVVHLRRRAGRFRMSVGSESREDWFSAVDGLVPAVGFSAAVFDRHRQFNHTFIQAYVSYKVARETSGYTLGFERPLFAAPKLYFGGALHELTASDDFWRLSTLEHSLVALGFKNNFRDYYERRGYQFNAALRVHPRHEFLALWRDEHHEALVNETDYSFFRDDHAYRDNVPAQAGELHALVFSYWWDSRGFDRETLEARYLRHQMDDLYGARGSDKPGWRVMWASEFATRDRLGGDFDYRRHLIHARRYVKLSPHQYFNARVLGGIGEGELPPQRTLALGGIGSVHGYRFKESAGERMALFNFEYKTELGTRDLRGVGFFDAGRVWRPVGDSADEWLRGVGIGLEVSSLRVDFGWRLDDIPRSLQVLVRLNPPF